jgi:nucleoside 2-deoxyribosyltransferase
MPISSDSLASEKKTAISEGAKRAGFKARFPDYLPLKPSFDLSEVVTEMREADSIIADLTRERPSCYYELGIAEAIGKNVHLVAEIGTPIHQTISRSLVRYYVNIDDLAKSVESALKEP